MKRGVDIGAFTLIELLCVVAIVALLAGLLMPVIGRVREAGRESACAGNLRQIGQAINSYAVDSKDLPSRLRKARRTLRLPPLKDVLKPYLAEAR
jgi:prepilin-type N-terminal cleavage/methylation domain-containing protein